MPCNGKPFRNRALVLADWRSSYSQHRVDRCDHLTADRSTLCKSVALLARTTVPV